MTCIYVQAIIVSHIQIFMGGYEIQHICPIWSHKSCIAHLDLLLSINHVESSYVLSSCPAFPKWTKPNNKPFLRHVRTCHYSKSVIVKFYNVQCNDSFLWWLQWMVLDLVHPVVGLIVTHRLADFKTMTIPIYYYLKALSH